MTEIQELREIVQAQAVRLTDTRAIARLNEYRWEQASDRIIELEKRLVLLTKLTKRMGRDLDGYIAADYGDYGGPASRYPYTEAGQRQLEAEAHEAEGKPEGHELVEDVQ